MKVARPSLKRAERESLPGTKGRGFSVRTFSKKCVDFHWHFHPEWELIFIHKGSGIRQIGRSVMPYASGDLCLIGSNLPHAFSSHPDERHGARWTVLHFLPQAWGDAFWQLPQNHRVSELFTLSGRGLSFTGGGSEDCASLMQKLEDSREYTMSTLLELFERLSKIPRTSLNPAAFLHEEGQKIDLRLQHVLSWMDEHFRQSDLTQAEAASLIGMSPQAFCRFFRQSTGRSFRRYVNELRVADACSSLKNPGASISEAAFGAGFNNLANFNRRFREILGRTPSEYRE